MYVYIYIYIFLYKHKNRKELTSCSRMFCHTIFRCPAVQPVFVLAYILSTTEIDGHCGNIFYLPFLVAYISLIGG